MIYNTRERTANRKREKEGQRERDREIEPNNQKHYRREQEDSHNGTQKDIGKDNINKETNNMNTHEKERERQQGREAVPSDHAMRKGAQSYVGTLSI